jgi:hypothetical protein
MRKLKIRHERMSGTGDLFEFESSTGGVVTVVNQRSGRRDLSIGTEVARETIATASLTRSEASALAALPVGAHIELTTDPSD